MEEKTLYSVTKKNKMDPVAFYFSIKQWTSDVKARITIIQNSDLVTNLLST